MSSSTEKNVALFPGCTCKTMVALKERRFDDMLTIEKQLQAMFAKFKTQDCCKCFQQWPEHWAIFIKLQGNHFKGDSMK
jgi:hypothetical protein